MRKAIGVFLIIVIAASVVHLHRVSFSYTVSAQTDHIVINEFLAAGAVSWIELYNPTTSAVNTIGWTISDTPYGGGEALDGDWGVSSIPAGGYVIHYTSLYLHESDGEIYLKDSNNNLIDDVYYGWSHPLIGKGGCPTGENGTHMLSCARAPNGIDTDDYARDWTLAVVPTPGTANNAPAPNLGGEGVVINEYFFFDPNLENSCVVELYNIGTTPVNLTDWWLTARYGYYRISKPTMIAPGGFQILDTRKLYPSYAILSLFTDTGVRADQLGLDDLPPSVSNAKSYQRGPFDGEGPNVGFNSESSGYPDHLIMASRTLNSTNYPAWDTTLDILFDDLTTPASDSWAWNVSVKSRAGNAVTGVTLTVRYAPYGTSSYTSLSGTPIDLGDGNYSFVHDVSLLKGSYHLKVKGTKTNYISDTTIRTLSVVGNKTLRVLWDGGHNQDQRYLSTALHWSWEWWYSVNMTWNLWRSFPNCVLHINYQPFSTSLLSNVDILIIPYIQIPLTSDERLALDQFLTSGGMVWWGGHNDMQRFNHTMNNVWISQYGFEFLNGTQLTSSYVGILDDSNNTGHPYSPIFHTFPSNHTLLNGITELPISNTTQVLVNPSVEGVSILATGDMVDTYWDADGSNTNTPGDINLNNTVPLAVRETGMGGVLIVSGGSEMLLDPDLVYGADQFWQNMYDYYICSHIGIALGVSPTVVNVNRNETTTFAINVTIANLGTYALDNVVIQLTLSNESLVEPISDLQVDLGTIQPSTTVLTTFTFHAIVDADSTIMVNVTVETTASRWAGLTKLVIVHAFTPLEPNITEPSNPILKLPQIIYHIIIGA
ncbi:MAG: lamin tail domain-containing protein, partial [Promethearchaeota archaeon]